MIIHIKRITIPNDFPTLKVAKRARIKVMKKLTIIAAIAKPKRYFGITIHKIPIGTKESPTRPNTCMIVEIGIANRSKSPSKKGYIIPNVSIDTKNIIYVKCFTK
jgi:hypothetical protein